MGALRTRPPLGAFRCRRAKYTRTPSVCTTTTLRSHKQRTHPQPTWQEKGEPPVLEHLQRALAAALAGLATPPQSPQCFGLAVYLLDLCRGRGSAQQAEARLRAAWSLRKFGAVLAMPKLHGML